MCGTCCRNDWQVTVDEKSYRRNERLFTVTNNQVEFVQAFVPLEKPGGPGEYATIAKRDGGCWFLEKTNRCRLHLAAGHEHLDSVCQTYPRYPIYTARGLEVTLSFSCPAVLELVSQSEPLTFVRSEDIPIDFDDGACVAQVFPRQQAGSSPLHYYFELEQHFINILQFRSLPLNERLEFLSDVVHSVNALQGSMALGDELRQLLYSHYDLLDDKAATGEQRCEARNQEAVTADILTEHFLVNLVFKKIGYLYGLERMVKLLQQIQLQINAACQEAQSQTVALHRAKAVIMELELQYSHNRQALIK
jgi:lysine-N-methylase